MYTEDDLWRTIDLTHAAILGYSLPGTRLMRLIEGARVVTLLPSQTPCPGERSRRRLSVATFGVTASEYGAFLASMVPPLEKVHELRACIRDIRCPQESQRRRFLTGDGRNELMRRMLHNLAIEVFPSAFSRRHSQHNSSPFEKRLFPCLTTLDLSYSSFDPPVTVASLVSRFQPGLKNVRLEGVRALHRIEPYSQELERYSLADASCGDRSLAQFLQSPIKLPGLKELDLSWTHCSGFILTPESIIQFHRQRLDISLPEDSLERPLILLLKGRRIYPRRGMRRVDPLPILREMYPGTEFVME